MHGKAAIKDQLGGPIIEIQEDRLHPLREESRQRLHDQLLSDMEHHSPEGEESHGDNTRWVLIGAVVLQVLVIGAGVAGLWLTAGPAAAGVGAIMIIGLYTIGVLPQWNAARIRWSEQREFEAKILEKIERMERRVACKTEGASAERQPPSMHSTRPNDWVSPRTMRAARIAAFGLLFAGVCVVLFIVL